MQGLNGEIELLGQGPDAFAPLGCGIRGDHHLDGPESRFPGVGEGRSKREPIEGSRRQQQLGSGLQRASFDR